MESVGRWLRRGVAGRGGSASRGSGQVQSLLEEEAGGTAGKLCGPRWPAPRLSERALLWVLEFAMMAGDPGWPGATALWLDHGLVRAAWASQLSVWE
ncbi:hypothetical protein P7K49_005874 [Saguinus oedipus]|uniref:Uncharacterized protein n=1 Tax=Saguinus oedipus TaxID=9490 RepID=A0ABQ9W0T6_SAGOE|nr:hypothetical protein P7K49_005874 [Saguinus oedipus]